LSKPLSNSSLQTDDTSDYRTLDILELLGGLNIYFDGGTQYGTDIATD